MEKMGKDSLKYPIIYLPKLSAQIICPNCLPKLSAQAQKFRWELASLGVRSPWF